MGFHWSTTTFNANNTTSSAQAQCNVKLLIVPKAYWLLGQPHFCRNYKSVTERERERERERPLLTLEKLECSHTKKKNRILQ